MHVAKMYVNGKVRFARVVKVASVSFDPRPGWVFTDWPLDKPAHKRDYAWFHPADVKFEWVRDFSFGGAA